MTHNITHAAWMNPLDNGQWEDWNPAWIKAVMDHLQVDTEEDIAAVFATAQHPDPDERLETHEYIQPGYKDREVVPYEGLSIGTLRFGHCFVNGVRVPCCTDLHGGGHPETLYVATDNVRGLPTPFHADNPETGLPEDYPGPGAEGNCVSHMTQMLSVDLPLCGSIVQYTCHSPFGGEQVVTMLTLPNLECGMVVERNSILVRTQVKAAPKPDATPYPGWRDPGGDPTRLHCSVCGVSHYPADLTAEDVCPRCLPAAPTPETPPNDNPPAWYVNPSPRVIEAVLADAEDELPVGNVTPEDLHTELFPGDEI